MSNVQPLNASRHADLRIDDRAGAANRRWNGFVEIVGAEIALAATRYPIFFAKSAETGRFMAGMLHGIQSGDQVRSYGAPDPEAYVPFALAREGFFIVGEDLGIDLDHPRISRAEGRSLFDGEGQPTAALQEVRQAVSMLKHGRDATEAFIQALLQHGLLEPIAISLEFDDAERLSLDGLYTVGLDQLKRLDDAAVLALFRAGHLQAALAVAGSLRQLPLLASQRNRLLAVGVAPS